MKKQYTAEEKKEYFAKQKAEIEQALIDGVKACYTSGNFRKYLDTVSKFHSYSLNNCLLIAMQMPNATYVAGYNDWFKKFKRHVKAGEKAIRILAPVPCKAIVQVDDGEGGKTDKEINYMRYRVVSVFDYSQTDGEEIPQICKELKGEVENYDALISNLEQVANVPVTYEDITSGAHGYYSRDDERIVIQKDMAQEQTVKTLVHEIAHSILHNKNAFFDIPREVKEIQAESVAYMVCSNLGLDTSDYSFEYVASWAQQDMKKLMEQMDVVRKTADHIIESIEKDAFLFEI